MYEGKMEKRDAVVEGKRNGIDTTTDSVSTQKTLALNGACCPRILAMALQS
jgi:hypothetical protein